MSRLEIVKTLWFLNDEIIQIGSMLVSLKVAAAAALVVNHAAAAAAVGEKLSSSKYFNSDLYC